MARVLFVAKADDKTNYWADHVYLSVISNGGEFTNDEEHQVAVQYLVNQFKDNDIQFNHDNIHLFSIKDENGTPIELRFEIFEVPEFSIEMTVPVHEYENGNVITIPSKDIIKHFMNN